MPPTGTTWELPPLILHPFADRDASKKLVENSRAALILCGLLPGISSPEEKFAERVLAGRYAELRMLYFLGKDLFRWIEQCMELVERTPELAATGIREQSFAMFISQNPPQPVQQKLRTWGVADAGTIFSRAMALNRIFATAPEVELLCDDFIHNYHRYADALFACYCSTAFAVIGPETFHFALYASGEYSRILENEWGAG